MSIKSKFPSVWSLRNAATSLQSRARATRFSTLYNPGIRCSFDHICYRVLFNIYIKRTINKHLTELPNNLIFLLQLRLSLKFSFKKKYQELAFQHGRKLLVWSMDRIFITRYFIYKKTSPVNYLEKKNKKWDLL